MDFGPLSACAPGSGDESALDRLIRSVDLHQGPTLSDQVVKVLKRHRDRRPITVDGVLQEGLVPFQHLVIKARHFSPSDEEVLARQLLLRCGDYAEGFQVSMIESELVEAGRARCFFGTGVFAPPYTAVRVADLEFAASDPTTDKAAQVFHPRLSGLHGRNADRPAAWYQGQIGLALSLDESLTPAVLPRDAFDDRVQSSLDGVILYFGRFSAPDYPTFRVLRQHPAGHSVQRDGDSGIICPTMSDWYRRDRDWQVINIGNSRIWFRYSNRTGPFRFTPSIDSVVKKAKGIVASGRFAGCPILSVEGLIVPSVPSFSLFSGSAVRSWQVQFDRDGRFRHSEAAGCAYSAVNRTGNRFGVFNHHAQYYARDEATDSGEVTYPLSENVRIGLRNFDPRRLTGGRGTVADKAYSAIYRRSALALVMQVDGSSGYLPFGGMTIRPDALFRLVSKPKRAQGPPVSPLDADSDDEDGGLIPSLSLDWVNRGARVEQVGWIGLADYWLKTLPLNIKATASALFVSSEGDSANTRSPAGLNYEINDGELGAVGPLLVRYYWYRG